MIAQQGRLAENVMHFARLLRAAGLRIGPDRVVDCVRALEIAGQGESVPRREDWYWTMSAVLLSKFWIKFSLEDFLQSPTGILAGQHEIGSSHQGR